jgi:hypothetical protein
MRTGHFTIKRQRVDGPFSYWTFRLTGWLRGRRIRKQFKSEAEAAGAKVRYEIEAANAITAGLNHVRPVNTALAVDQVREAEAAFHRLGNRSLSFAVDWFLGHYRPPVVAKALADAVLAFREDRAPRVSFYVKRDYKRELAALEKAFPGRQVHDVTTEDLQAYLTARRLGPKAWNNVRGSLHAFFEWSRSKPRQWCLDNPARPLVTHKIARGIPRILTSQQAAELMAFLETYPAGTRQKARPGYLVPYFALCLFAGIRPTVPRGEAWKLGKLCPAELARAIDLPNGVIRIDPAVSKTRDLRQVTIQPNLRAWLERYPVDKYPITVPAMQAKVMEVRKRFGLTDDVLRHSFCSYHVAKFQSLGATALEAGNSERVIRRHYLNMVTPSEADAFWRIECTPSSPYSA